MLCQRVKSLCPRGFQHWQVRLRSLRQAARRKTMTANKHRTRLDRLLAGSNGKCEDEVEHLASGTARNSFIGRPPPSLVVNHR
jgi:hypothetical protein